MSKDLLLDERAIVPLEPTFCQYWVGRKGT